MARGSDGVCIDSDQKADLLIDGGPTSIQSRGRGGGRPRARRATCDSGRTRTSATARRTDFPRKRPVGTLAPPCAQRRPMFLLRSRARCAGSHSGCGADSPRWSVAKSPTRGRITPQTPSQPARSSLSAAQGALTWSGCRLASVLLALGTAVHHATSKIGDDPH